MTRKKFKGGRYVLRDGKLVPADGVREVVKPGWPRLSDAMAVHPDQIAEASELSKKKGVPTHYDEWGRPRLTDARHERRYMKAFGFFHRNSYT